MGKAKNSDRDTTTTIASAVDGPKTSPLSSRPAGLAATDGRTHPETHTPRAL